MTKILYAKDYVDKKTEEIKSKVAKLKFTPTLAVIRVGEDSGSISYERGIKSTASKLGVDVAVCEFSVDTNTEEIVSKIEELNKDEKVGGIIIFKPLPKDIDEDKIAFAIDHKKDIDCMNPINMAKLYNGEVDGFMPLAPKASVELLKFYGYELKGLDTVIINHSTVVGKPLAMLLLNELATVTICHVGTKDLKKHTQNADIVFTAMGIAEMLDESYFNENSTVIDIGTSKNKEGKYRGDLDEKSIDGKIKAYSPVPKGIGSITNLLLIENVINYY